MDKTSSVPITIAPAENWVEISFSLMVKVFLQGPYNDQTGLMNDYLRSTLSTTSPYTDQLEATTDVFNS